jgi:hypothetical protein
MVKPHFWQSVIKFHLNYVHFLLKVPGYFNIKNHIKLQSIYGVSHVRYRIIAHSNSVEVPEKLLYIQLINSFSNWVIHLQYFI